MKTSRRIFLSFLCFILVVVSVCPSFAFATDSEVYTIPFSRPQLNEYSGFAEVLFERSSGYRYVRLFYWQYLSASNGSGTEYLNTDVTINYGGVDFGVAFSGNPSDVFFGNLTIYDPSVGDSFHFNIVQDSSSNGVISFDRNYNDEIISFNLYGNYTSVFSNMIDSYLPSFTVNYGDDTSLNDVSSVLNDINNTLLQLHNDNLIFIEDVEYIQSQLSQYFELFHSDFNTINNNILTAITWLDYISDQLNDFSDRVHEDAEAARTELVAIKSILSEMNILLANIDSNVTTITSRLNQIYTLLRQNIAPDVDDIRKEIIKIRELLSQSVSNNLTSPDTSDLDGYLDAENSLLNNSNVDVSDVVKVEVNQNALTVIWDLVQGVFDQSGKVFGMVLTVLSLGLVAMVLGRKV